MNGANKHKKSIKIDANAWGKWSIENCARNQNLTIWTREICTNQNPTYDTHRVLWDFKTDHLILARWPEQVIVNKKEKKKKKTDQIVDLAVPADHKIKLEKSKRRDKYQDFARELQKLWNIKKIVILIVNGSLGMVSEVVVREDLEIRG